MTFWAWQGDTGLWVAPIDRNLKLQSPFSTTPMLISPNLHHCACLDTASLALSGLSSILEKEDQSLPTWEEHLPAHHHSCLSTGLCFSFSIFWKLSQASRH